MRETLREEQRRLAQERIIEAAAEELVESGLANLSVPAVAERAGVSLRTVYNHFETKDVLLDAIVATADARFNELGGIFVETDLDQLPEAIRTNWRIWGELGVLGQAMVLVDLDRAAGAGRAHIPTHNQPLTDAIREGLRERAPKMSDEELDAATAVVRLVVSFASWQRLTYEFGLDTTTSGNAVAWAFATLRDAIARGEGPLAEA